MYATISICWTSEHIIQEDENLYITKMLKTEIFQTNKLYELEIYPPTQDAGSSPPGLLIIYIFRLGIPYKPFFATATARWAPTSFLWSYNL